MPRRKTSGKPPKRPIERYEHEGKKRINNPPVGLVTPETDPPLPTHKVYDYLEPVPTVKPGKDLDYIESDKLRIEPPPFQSRFATSKNHHHAAYEQRG